MKTTVYWCHAPKVQALAAQCGKGPELAVICTPPATVAGLIAELAERTTTGYLFGGLASSRQQTLQFAVGGNGNGRRSRRDCDGRPRVHCVRRRHIQLCGDFLDERHCGLDVLR